MNKLICLMYHNISKDKALNRYAISENIFDKQLNYIKNNKFLSVDTFDFDKILADKVIHISFDDGAITDYEVAVVLLEKYSLKGTFFITTSNIGTSGYMNWEQVKKLHNRGYDIQSHTHSHELLSTLSEEKIKQEVVMSKDILEQKLGKKILAISLPGGSFNKKVLEITFLNGYKYIFTSVPAINELGKPNIYHRVLIKNNMQTSDFEKILSGDNNFYRKSKSLYYLKAIMKSLISRKLYLMLWRKFYKEK